MWCGAEIPTRLALALLWCSFTSHWQPCAGGAELERNNWAVLVDTSRYWYNYRHVANVLSFYHTIKRLGIPDSQIILMLAEDMPCNPRNAKPGMVFNEMHHRLNLYGEEVEVDYRGDEVSVENFLRLLTGRHPPSTARSKRLLTDAMSNVLIFITGHSGEEFIKFQDWEEITSTDIADAFEQMHKQRRYRNIFWISDTCQAATLQNQFYTPEIIAFGSSGKKENSYSHHVDQELGVAVIDRFTYYALDFFNRMTTTSAQTVQDFQGWFDPRHLSSHPEMRTDLFSRAPSEIQLTEFIATTGRMRFQSNLLELRSSRGAEASSSSTCSVLPAGWGYGGSDIATPPLPGAAQAAEEGPWARVASAMLDFGAGVGRQRPGASFSGALPAAPAAPAPGAGGTAASVAAWLLAFAGVAAAAGSLL